MANSSMKKTWLFRLALVLLVALVPLGYFLFLPPRTPAAFLAPPMPTAPDAAVELKIAEVKGLVEVRRKDGAWRPATLGTLLQHADVVRTKGAAWAVLQSHEEYRIRLEEQTELSVDQLTQSISRLLLETGMATADVKKRSSRTFEVRAAHSDALARSRGGTFSVASNGSGTVAVGAHQGDVEFSGNGKVVVVHSGEQSLVWPDHAPTPPANAPNSLLLKVRWPSDSLLRTKTAVVEGQTQPGAIVSIAGQPARVDRAGHFATQISLQEGKNVIDVHTHTVSQGAKEERREIEVDTHPPSMRLDPRLWDPPRH
jgi:hypothetical protein